MMKSKYQPGLLGKRPEFRTAEYHKSGDATGLVGVRVTMSTTSKPHEVVISEGDGIISRRLRRYGLALARYSLPVPKYAKKWDLPEFAVQMANAYISATAYREAYKDDHTDGTYSPEPLINLLTQEEVPLGALMEALSMVDTKHEKPISDAFIARHPHAALQLEEMLSLLRRMPGATHPGDYFISANKIRRCIGDVMREGADSEQELGRSGKKALRYSRLLHRDIARFFANAADSIRVATQIRRGISGDQEPEDSDNPSATKPFREERLSEDWADLLVEKPPLLLPHSGKMGRRIIPWHTGRFPRYLHRMVTDPQKRIFSRKTRALGAVVVIDCSGSMGLTQSDVKRLIHASAGASVLCYSHRRGWGSNAWVVGRNGRQIGRLPNFPGGNGVDGPALLWAAQNLRRDGKSPMYWISDGYVTGKTDCCADHLSEECERIRRRYNIRRLDDVETAIRCLAKEQRKANL